MSIPPDNVDGVRHDTSELRAVLDRIFHDDQITMTLTDAEWVALSQYFAAMPEDHRMSDSDWEAYSVWEMESCRREPCEESLS